MIFKVLSVAINCHRPESAPLKAPTDVCLGTAYYVSCLKRLWKIKYGFEGSWLWSVLAKQPINV